MYSSSRDFPLVLVYDSFSNVLCGNVFLVNLSENNYAGASSLLSVS